MFTRQSASPPEGEIIFADRVFYVSAPARRRAAAMIESGASEGDVRAYADNLWPVSMTAIGPLVPGGEVVIRTAPRGDA